MKKIIFFLILILGTKESLYAQIYFSTNSRQEGRFNTTTTMYDSTFEDNKALSYFEFDEQLTKFKHHTFTTTSSYRIKSTKKDEANGRWEFDIVSGAGYSYYMIIDMLNNNIRFIYKEKGSTYLTQFAINEFWVDK